MKAKLKAPTDEQLVSQLIQGATAPMGELYQRYSQKVFHKCLSFVKNHDEAFDLSQDILLKAFDKIRSYGGNSSFSTWLYSITNNHCIEHLRKQKGRRTSDIFELLHIQEEVIDLEERLLHENMEEQIASTLHTITDDEREMLILKYQKKRSVKELQELFGLSASAVKMRLMRTRQKILLLHRNAELQHAA